MSPAVALDRTELLTFRLRDALYALPVTRVHEVLEYSLVTRVPATPPYVLGVIDLRGRMVPVVDLSAKLDLGACAIGRRSCIVVTEVELAGLEPRATAGILVEEIGGLIDLVPGHEAATHGGAQPADVCWIELDRGDGAPVRLLDVDAAMRDVGGAAGASRYNDPRLGASERYPDGLRPEAR